MKYKLICIDMDGTLLNDNNEVSYENELSLKRAINKGIQIAITTGRLYGSAREYADKLNLDCHIIASNGTYIKSKDEKNVLYSSSLTIEQLTLINSIFKEFKLKAYFNSVNDVLIEESNQNKDSNNKKLKKSSSVNFIKGDSIINLVKTLNKPIYRATAIEDIDRDALLTAKSILEKYDDFEIVTSMSNNFDVMPAGTSKGNGVKELSSYLGIDSNEIICIGDRENDISMITFAGVGVAMGNATEDLKEHADYITDTNNNSGVAKAINKFILVD